MEENFEYERIVIEVMPFYITITDFYSPFEHAFFQYL